MGKPNITETRERLIVGFCMGGKTSAEIAEHLGLDRSTILNYLSRMQKDGRIKKVVPPAERRFGNGGTPAFFVTTGTVLDHAPVQPAKAPAPVEPVWNEEFIAVMHRILCLEPA